MKPLIFLVLTFVGPIYWGATHKSVWGVAIWAVVLAVVAVLTGWRYQYNGPIKSGVIGAVFALLVCITVYSGAYWLSR
jgi:hypothetical protein